jgi:hypothetical protein
MAKKVRGINPMVNEAILINAPSRTGITLSCPGWRRRELSNLTVRYGRGGHSVEVERHDRLLAVVEVVQSQITFGTRTYFLCPGCGRRCMKVYVEGALVACRNCCGLKYERQTASERRLWDEMRANTGLTKRELRKVLEQGSRRGSGTLPTIEKTPTL